MDRAFVWPEQSGSLTRRPDDGMTLIELIVAMMVFIVFMSVVLTTTVTLAQSATRAQLTAEASNASLAVFGAFDRQARYADAINFPGQSTTSTARYVEFHTPANSSASGVAMCTQWRFVPSLNRLEYRTWQDIPGAVIPTVFATKLTNVIDDGGAEYPFELTPASTDGSKMQQLTVTLNSGNAHFNAGAAMSTTFVARNSSIKSLGNKDNDNNHVSDEPVCNPIGNRP